MLLKALKGEDLHQAVFDVIARHLDVERYQCFIFGSEARNENWMASDLDIGITGEHAVNASVLECIREDLESLPSLRMFDVVDFYGVSPEFRSHALKSAVSLHGKIEGA